MVQIASVTALDGAQLAVDEHIAVRIHADRVAVLEGYGQAVGSQLVLAGLDKVRIGGVGLLTEKLYDSGFLVVSVCGTSTSFSVRVMVDCGPVSAMSEKSWL